MEIKVKLMPGTIAWLKKQKDSEGIIQVALFYYRQKLAKEKLKQG